MSKAVAGASYTIEKGDTLSGISAAAYGDPKKWRLIWKANKTRLKSNDPNKIYPGETIKIPGDPVNKELTSLLDIPDLPGAAKDDFTLVVDGLEIPVVSSNITRTMDTAADGWSAIIPWNPGSDKRLDDAVRPYSFKPASVYLGETMMIDGYLYNLKISIKKEGNTAELTGFSYTAEVIDNSVSEPFEHKNITLFDRAKELTEDLGIEIVYDSEDTEVFKKVSASPSDTILAHLAPLADQRGILISSNRAGALLFTNATTGYPVGTLKEGTSLFLTPEITFSGRDRFSSYRVTRKSKRKGNRSATATDEAISFMSRLKTFSANDTTFGNLQQAVDWRRSRQLAQALAMEFPVNDWYAPNGELWEENTIITVESPSLLMPDGFDFVIRAVNYTFDKRGRGGSLSLIPPQAYTGFQIVEPWLGE